MGKDWKKKLKKKALEKIKEKGKEFMEEKGKAFLKDKVEELKETVKDKLEKQSEEVPSNAGNEESKETPVDTPVEEKTKEVTADAEVKEPESKPEPEPEPKVADKGVKEDGAKEAAPVKPKELTPEEKRAAAAMVLQVSMYPDGVLEIKSIQNINSRAMAEYLVSRAKDDYFKSDVAGLCAVRLIDLINQSKKNKDKTGGIWTPGKKK